MTAVNTADRDLLELAAKAAGYTAVPGEVYHVGGDEVDCTDMLWIRSGEPDECDVYWNPLDDDGDALRLAVKLHLHKAIALAHRLVDDKTDFYAATRRAIVRAAAAIGEQQ